MRIRRLIAWAGLGLGAALLCGVVLAAARAQPATSLPPDAGSLAALDAVAETRARERRPAGGERFPRRAAAIRREAARVRARPARIGALRRAARRARPVALRVPALDLRARILSQGVRGAERVLQLPTSQREIAWYRGGPAPGRPGTAVLAAHADYDGRPGPFLRLRTLDPGARVAVTLRSGATRWFRVVARRTYAKDDLPDRLGQIHGRPVLALITCGGEFDPATRTYADNTVVYAI